MLRVSIAKYTASFTVLLGFLCFAQFSEAQKKKASGTNVVKKLIRNVAGKKNEPVGETAAKADAEVKMTPKGRLPVIIIPGLIGSELVNKETDEKVWFKLERSSDDDLRLPLSPDLKANRDKLVPRDILRKVQLIRLTPEIEIYQKLIDSLQAEGFTESKIDSPAENGFADTFYVFPYDWRRDNVENAQILLQKLDDLRTKLKRPDLKFNVVAHSMGGLIARYAEMYGKADLTAAITRPSWKGAAYFNQISLIATPNAGALTSLDSLLNGFSLFGNGTINLPFVQNLSKYDLFTIPSIYQLLPHDGTVRAFDENLKPIKIDIYNPATWEKYGWTAYTDEGFKNKFNSEEQAQAKAYFQVVLLRAKQFQAALDARSPTRNPVPIYYFGSECKPTIDGMIIHKTPKKDSWETDFGAASFVKSDGTKVTEKETEKVTLAPGDGVVPKHSLIASLMSMGKSSNPQSGVGNNLTIACGEHNRLTGDTVVTKSLFGILDTVPTKKIVKKTISKRRR